MMIIAFNSFQIHSPVLGTDYVESEFSYAQNGTARSNRIKVALTSIAQKYPFSAKMELQQMLF